jgi:hypothetical protein
MLVNTPICWHIYRLASYWHNHCGFFRERACSSGYKSPGSTSSPGFDSPWERISQDLTAFVLSVVGGVLVDSEAPVVTSSILRICRHSLSRCSSGRVCVRVLIG